MNDFQIVKETSLWKDRSLLKFSWRYNQELSSGWVRHCWCLAEVCTLRMSSKIAMVSSLALAASLVKFHKDVISG